MSQDKSIFEKTLGKLKEMDKEEVDEEIEEDYGDDFENDEEESESKKKESPVKKTEAPKKEESKETKVDVKPPTLKEDTSAKEIVEKKPVQPLEKPKGPELDPDTLEGIDLEECLIELKGIVKRKRLLFLQFCEEKENFRLKVQRKLEETQVTTTNPFKRLQKEQEKKKSLEEARKIARTGIISLDDFIAVLNDFEFRQKNRDIIIKFLKALQCYFPHNSTVYYFKVLRQLSRRVNHFSKITRTFEYVKPIRHFDNKENATTYIKNAINKLRQKIQEKNEKLKQKLQKEYDLDIKIDDIAKDPEKFLNLLREKITASKKSLNDIFKAMDTNGDGLISFEEFKNAMADTQIHFPEDVIKEIYRRFDKNESNSISYMEFLSTIYADPKTNNVFDYMRNAEANYYQLKKILQANFNLWEDFYNALNLGTDARLTEPAFKQFVQSITDVFSRIQLSDIFAFLDTDRRRFLDIAQLKKLYMPESAVVTITEKQEPQKPGAEIRTPGPDSTQKALMEVMKEPSEKIEAKGLPEKTEEKTLAEKIIGVFQRKDTDQSKTLSTAQDKKVSEDKDRPVTGDKKGKIEETKLDELKKLSVASQQYKPEVLSRTELLEKFMIEFSASVLRILKSEGKNLRDLFNIFSKEVNGYLNQTEFQQACNFIMNEHADPEFCNSFFNFFVVGYPKKMSFKTFSHIVFTGKKGNTIYIKLKHKFKQHLDANRKVFLSEFQRLDSVSGSGEVALADLKRLFANNEINLDDNDIRLMKDEDIVVVRDDKPYVRYHKFMKTIFPETNPIEKEVQMQALHKIMRFFIRMRYKKERERKREEALRKAQALDLRDSARKKASKSTGRTGRSKKVAIQPEPVHEEPQRTKPKEIFELEKMSLPVPAQIVEKKVTSPDRKKTTSSGRAASSKRSKVETLTTEEKLKKTLGEPPKDEKAKEKAAAIYAKCKTFVIEMVDKAIGYGESLKLSREIQKKYETRPVLKDVFITLQDLEVEVFDPLPRSLGVSTMTGRLGYLDKEGNLLEYDIPNQQKLRGINISSKVPLKKTKIMDYVFDDKAGRIYILTDSWMLEVWEIHQELSVPVNRLKILTEEFDPKVIDSAYQKRFGDTFPEFMTLSCNSHQLLIVNCSAVNNSIVFVDPVSVSVFSQIYLKQDDYKVPTNLTKILHFLKPKLDEMAKNIETFEHVFSRYTKTHNNEITLNKFDFIAGMREVFGLKEIKDQDLDELFSFLDQDNDGTILIQELSYLHEIAKIASLKKKEDKSTIPLSLQGLDQATLNVLQKLNDFVKKSRLNLVEAFRIFDSNNSGYISASEFFDVLDQLVGDISYEDKQNLLKAADTDKNGSIDFKEFCGLFSDVEQYNAINELKKNTNIRTNLMSLIEKAYENDIDMEALFLKYDKMAQGTLQVIEFTDLIRSLPFGVLESEIDYLLKYEVVYTDNGRVDYQRIIQDPQFTKAKIISKLKDTSSSNKGEIKELLHRIDADDSYFESHKIIVESIIYVDDFDLMIYTTLLPRTSTIFVSSTKRQSENLDNISDTKQIFSNKLLARLEGHKSGYPPTIYYCSESGCLISGDKIDKKVEFTPKTTNPFTNAPTKDTFLNFYQNIETSRQNSCDIIIWNFQKNLFDLCNTNPPWRVFPSHVIKAAHYDSILDITYLPISQLIVSASADKTIKIWDPVARPFSLKHPKNISLIRRKPGIYEPANEQFTQSNQKFCEIKRIYTGDQTCHKLHVAVFKTPTTNLMKDQNFSGKVIHFESLLTLTLSKPQLSGKQLKRVGFIRGYSVDRLQIEIPANRVDDVIPKKYYKELEDLCIERRKKALSYFQRYLPTLLETTKVKVILHNNNLQKIMNAFKKISLMKFDPSKELNLDEELLSLFKLFTQLPLRVSFEKFLSEAGLQNQLSIAELFYYLKKFRQIHPLSITKSEFVNVVTDIDKKTKKNILSEHKMINLLMENISKAIRAGHIDFKTQLYEGKKDGFVTREKFQSFCAEKGVWTSERDIEELMNSVDPFISNKIFLSHLEDIFGNDILEYKLTLYNRPTHIIRNLLGNLDGKQKMLLLFSLNECNLNKDNYLTREEFLQGFLNSGLSFNKIEVLELFELLAEKYSNQDDNKYLNLNYFSRKMFTQNENFELIRIYFIIGKLKNGIIYKRLIPQQLFAEYNPETKTYSKGSLHNISTQDFIERVESIRIPNLHRREIEKLANFLSIQTPTATAPFISLNLLLSYFMKLEVKYQYASVSNFTKLIDSVADILIKEEELRVMQGKMSKKKIDAPTLRHLLSELKIAMDQVDEILVRFLDEKETSLEQFITKLKNFMESMAALEEKLAKPTFHTQGSVQVAEAIKEFKGEDKFTLKNLLETKIKDEKGETIQNKFILDRYRYTEELVKAIGAEGKKKLDNLREICESFDFNKTGKLKLPTFANIILFNCNGVSEELLVNFQNEYERIKKETSIDYHSFFDEHFLEKKTDTKREVEVNLNNIMVKISSAIKASKVNVAYAFKFFDESLQNTVTEDEFKKVFAWIKPDLVQEEFDFLINYLKTPRKQIDYNKFLNLVEISGYNLSSVYEKEIWIIASEILRTELIEKASINSEYLRYYVNQKLKEAKPTVPYPLVSAILLHKALGQMKYEFTLKEVDDLVNYAIIGSKPSRQEAQAKVQEVDLIDITTEIINFDHFLLSFNDVLAKRKEVERLTKPLRDALDLSEAEAQERAEQKHLINKIKGILRERDVTVWESIISTNMTISEQSKISLNEFKLIMNSLNLGLTLREKLILYKIADPRGTEKVDLQTLIDLFEEKGLSERAYKVILEKFAVALFFNDMSLKALFDQLDEDKDELVFQTEMVHGLCQLDLGLSIFEIKQIMTLLQFDRRNQISRTDFTRTLEDLFKKHEIDPSKDLSFSLYAKIKNIISVKGVDLLECFKTVDISNKGYVDYAGFLKALETFGLDNLKPYQISALLKFNKVPLSKSESQISKNAASKKPAYISPRSPDFKVSYEEFCKALLAEVDRNTKMVIEVTHDLLRKTFKMIQGKNVSLFEAFVYFDINNTNAISKLEFKLGLQNFNIYFTDREISQIWGSFEKNKNFKVTFSNFLKSFIDAGALPIIKFDEAMDLLIKKFSSLMSKYGNFEESFRKLDAHNNGFITLNEFKEQCHKLYLGLLPNEVESIFTALTQVEKDTRGKLSGESHLVGFTYRQYVRLLIKYKNIGQVDQVFAKIHQNARDRKIIWKQQFQSFKSAEKGRSGELSLRDLKALLKHLKLGITNEEIDTVIDCFDTSFVNYQFFDRRVSDGAKKIDQAAQEKNLLIHSLVNEINHAVTRDRIPIERLFFDFDEHQSGTIDINQFANMIFFLKITATKHQIRTLFDAIDYDKKGYISLNELKNFMEESTIQQQESKEKLKLETRESKQREIYMRIKEALINSNISIQRALTNNNQRLSELMTQNSLEKLLVSLGVVLKADELHLLFDKVLESSGGATASWEDFQNFAIKEQIEVLNLDEKVQHIHPAVAVYIEKMNNIFKKLEINPAVAFNYLANPQRKVIMKRAFLRGIQAFGMNMTRDDIILLFEYFDEKGYGEINLDTFLEKFELLTTLSLHRISNAGGDEVKGDLSAAKMSLRHQVLGILQKIYMYFVEKKYNKRQMVALFDKNGNGILSRDDFIDGIKALGLEIPLEKARALAKFLDKGESGTIEIDDFIAQLHESVPQNLKGNFKMNQALAIFRTIVERIKELSRNLLVDIVKYEKSVKTEELHVLKRPKTGIYVLDLYKLFKDFAISLNEDEKNTIKDAFYIRTSDNFLDIEGIYNAFDNIVKSTTDFLLNKGATESELNELFEQKIFRQIGNKLRDLNMSIIQAFEHVDQDKDNYITEKEFKNLFKNLSMELSDRELSFLLTRFSTHAQGIISKNEFTEKFWHAFAHFGQRIESDRIKDLKNHQRKIITNCLSFFKNKQQWTPERTWVLFDQSKRGFIDLEDLRNALIEVNYYMTKEDTALLFNFIDQSHDGKIDFIEFCSFWNEDVNLFDEGVPQDNELQQLEQDILEHLAKVINAKEMSLWDFYHDLDRDNKGFLTEKEFGFLLKKLGLELNDIKTEQLMRVIDSNADKRITYSDLETRLLNSGMEIKVKKQVEKVKWIDKGLKNFLIGLNSHLKHETYAEFFKKFDSDYDGYLTAEEYFNALKSMGKIMSEDQAQRAAHIFQTELLDNRIAIDKIVDIINHVLKVEDTKSDQYEIAAVNLETFKYIVINFEGMNMVFSILSEAKKNYKEMQRFFGQNRKKIRGYSLIATQNSLNHLTKVLNSAIDRIQKGMNLLLRQSTRYITNQALVKFIDPAHNVQIVDKDKLKESERELDKVTPFVLGDNAVFNVDFDAYYYVSPYIKMFKGYYFRTNSPILINYYDKETLGIVCTDGNQFWKHLDFELKVHNYLAEKTDFLFKNLAKYEKRVGLDSAEKDCYIINEYIDETKWISLLDLILQNGGLLRVPFLARTKACIFIVKYWANQLLNIMSHIHNLGCSLLLLRPENIMVSRDGQKIKLRALRGIGKISEFGKVLFAPDFYINLFGPNVNPEATKKAHDPTTIQNDPYIAPEMIFNKIQELDQMVDTWAFGCLLYHILFGVPPTSFYQDLIKAYPNMQDIKGFTLPSDYFYHDLFPDHLINDILYADLEVKNAHEKQTRMIDCISQKSFEALFNDIFPVKNIVDDMFDKNNKEFFNQIGSYLDLIAACLDFLPSRRPTIKALSLSPVFQLDSYETMISRQFAEVMILYRSPSLTIRDRVWQPLRQIAAKVIKNPKTVISFEEDILHIMDAVNWSLLERKPKPIEDMKKTVTSKFTSSNLKYSNVTQSRLENVLKEDERNRANNQPLAKFIFENKVLDLLVFLTLRHHTQSRKYLKKKNAKIERSYDDTVRLVKSMLEIFKTIIFDMTGYDTTCSPYVQVFMENFVKFFIGEEFKLASDVADIQHENQEIRIIHNFYKEYAALKVNIAESFFRDSSDTRRDEADAAWKEAFSSRSYLFTESHWTPDLYLLVGPLYKDSVSESGVGSFNYPVIQDYIKFESENNREFDFDMENRIRFMNHKASSYYRRTSEYFNDILHIAENLQVLYHADGKNKSNIRVSFQYIKALLQSNHTDKIKLVLDSKILVQIMRFLAIDDVHVRAELLEILYEVSRGFEREIMSLISREKQEAVKSVEESIKTVGVISQLQKSNTKDTGAKNQILSISYDYYLFNRKINNKYLRELGAIFESPVVMSYMTAVIKTQAELLQNKKFVIKIFENITNGPLSVIKALNYASTDTIISICKILVINRKGMELKQNVVLAPALTEAFKKILCDCRPEIIDMLCNIPGARAMLKEQNLEIPPKLSLTLLFDTHNDLAEFYEKNRNKLIHEIQGGIVASQLNSPNQNTENLLKLNSSLYKLNTMILSWLWHYLLRKEGEIGFVDIKACFDKIIDLYINIFDHLFEYGQINLLCADILNQVGYLFESLGANEFWYLFLTPKDMKRAEQVAGWLIDKIYQILAYYSSLEQDEGKVTLKERDEALRISTLTGKEQKSLILNSIMTKESIKRYGENKLMPTCHAFQRIFHYLLSLNDKGVNTLIKNVEFAKHFVTILRTNYHILSAAIKTHTETIHIITNYAEESRLRLKIFEKLLKVSNDEIKQELVATGVIHDICQKYLNNHDELDVSAKKLTFGFLPFRNFFPIRNEALGIISLIVRYKDVSEFVHRDLILALVRYANLTTEYENLRKHKRGLIQTSALYFFTIMMNVPDEQIQYVMRQDKIIDFLKDLIRNNQDLKNYFRDLAQRLEV